MPSNNITLLQLKRSRFTALVTNMDPQYIENSERAVTGDEAIGGMGGRSWGEELAYEGWTDVYYAINIKEVL